MPGIFEIVVAEYALIGPGSVGSKTRGGRVLAVKSFRFRDGDAACVCVTGPGVVVAGNAAG